MQACLCSTAQWINCLLVYTTTCRKLDCKVACRLVSVLRVESRCAWIAFASRSHATLSIPGMSVLSGQAPFLLCLDPCSVCVQACSIFCQAQSCLQPHQVLLPRCTPTSCQPHPGSYRCHAATYVRDQPAAKSECCVSLCTSLYCPLHCLSPLDQPA